MKVNFIENAFVTEEKGRRTVLLDCKDLIKNKSRIPMQAVAGELTIPSLIMRVWENCKEISCGTDWENGTGLIAVFLLDILATDLLICTSAPIKIAEVGAVDGVLSYNLASLMGITNKESSLCSICNVIGNDSDNHWLDRIVMVEQPPKLSMMVSDYDNTGLQSGNFDIVVLNGMHSLGEPYDVLCEAKRIVKKGGTILCYLKNTPLLESTFKLIFPDCREYELTPDEKILSVQYDGESWMPYKEKEESVKEVIDEIIKEIQNGNNSDQLRHLVVRIDDCVDKAMLKNDLKKKEKLINLKEKLLDYMLNMEKDDEEYYKIKLLEDLSLYADFKEHI